jgi:hypothetical protein
MKGSYLPLPRRLSTGAAFSLTLLLLTAGCASVDTQSFVAFSASVERLKSGSEAHTEATVNDSRDKLIRAVAAGELSPADLQLEFTGPFETRYGFADNEPTFIKYDRFQGGLVALNSALAGYAQALVVLAGGSAQGDILPSTEQFERMTRELNTNAMRAASTLGLNPGGDQSALLTTAAVQLFKAYLAHSRREMLQTAIQEVQPRILAFAELARQAVRILAGQIESDYNARFLSLALATPPKAPPLLKLNRETRAELAALKSIADSYRALPAAHQDLALAAARKPGLLAGLTAFNREADRLGALLLELKRTNAKANPAGKK